MSRNALTMLLVALVAIGFTTSSYGQSTTKYKVYYMHPEEARGQWQTYGVFNTLAEANAASMAVSAQNYLTHVGTMRNGRTTLPPIVQRPRQPVESAVPNNNVPYVSSGTSGASFGVSDRFLRGDIAYNTENDIGRAFARGPVYSMPQPQSALDPNFFDRINLGGSTPPSRRPVNWNYGK